MLNEERNSKYVGEGGVCEYVCVCVCVREREREREREKREREHHGVL